jgi:hypothetical protein
MLTLRPEQLETIRQHHLQKFEDEMVVHSKAFSPPICEILGEDQLRVALRSAMQRANGYGFTNRGPLRLFIEMMFTCGSGFDTDPQYPAVGEILRASEDQMARAQRIYQLCMDDLENVTGPDAVYVRKALSDLLVFTRSPLKFSNDFVADMLQAMHLVFPPKADYVGDPALKELIAEAIAEAQQYRFDAPRQKTLIVVLKFSFGHGCTDDPLYPWIANTLRDDKIRDADARAARLEKKATTWLEHVVARNERRAQA